MKCECNERGKWRSILVSLLLAAWNRCIMNLNVVSICWLKLPGGWQYWFSCLYLILDANNAMWVFFFHLGFSLLWERNPHESRSSNMLKTLSPFSDLQHKLIHFFQHEDSFFLFKLFQRVLHFLPLDHHHWVLSYLPSFFGSLLGMHQSSASVLAR